MIITESKNGWFTLKVTEQFDNVAKEFIGSLKEAVPAFQRKYDPVNYQWEIQNSHRQKVIVLATSFGFDTESGI